MALKSRTLWKLKSTTADPVVMYLASRREQSQRVDTLDKVYTRLMLGKLAVQDVGKMKH